jgi:hypothetical protein
MLATHLTTNTGRKIKLVPARDTGGFDPLPEGYPTDTLDPNKRRTVLKHETGNCKQATNYHICDLVQFGYQLDVAWRVGTLFGSKVG